VRDDKGIVVEYLLGDDELLIVTIASVSGEPDVAATLTPIDRRQLAEQINEALKPAVLRDPDAWKKQTAAIAGSVLAPIASRLAGRERCVIVPDDILWKLPFEALATADAPLAMPVSYATSLATLSLQQRVAAQPAPAAPPPAAPQPAVRTVMAAIVAAPVIPDAIRTQITLAQPVWKEPDAETARVSASAFRAVYGDTSTFTSGADATETAIRTAFDKADVIHTSAPLQVSGATPLFTYLALSASGDTPQTDGRWEVRDWFGATSHARVLVLGDATSFGSSGAGGALDLIAWSAAAAGVPALVVPRAPADGFTLDDVLTGFHTGLAKGARVGDAWTRAVEAARRAQGATPSGWAGARLIGASR
jgi:hypothetical protein